MDVDVGVTAALVAAFGSLLVAIVAAVFTARDQTKVTTLNHDLDQQGQHQERQLAAKAELNRYREPLLTAATELLDRIGNIRKGGFLAYLASSDEHRRRIALIGTSYRFAHF